MYKNKRKKLRSMTQAALIGALYCVLTFASMGLAGGAIQLRLSEALTILPIFTPAAVPGLFVGCLLSNLFTGAMPFDVIFGSLATLIGALGTRYLRKKPFFFCILPPVLSNALIVPAILKWVYGLPLPYPLLMLGVLVGQSVCCAVLGFILYRALQKRRSLLFPEN